jgi:hypothetical protein
LNDEKLATYRVARYYGVSPHEVDEWANVDFLDYQEFMWIQMEVDRKYQEVIKQQNG